MIRIPAISLIIALLCLLAVGHPAFAQGPPEEDDGVSFPTKNDTNISQLLLDSIGERSGAGNRDSGEDSKIQEPQGPGESADGEPTRTVGGLVRFDSSGSVQVYIHLKYTDEASLQEVRDAVAEVEIEAPEYGLMQAWVDPDGLQTVASLDAVQRITPPDYGITNAGFQSDRG